ncbi:MAG: hypothetical protein PHC35_07080 [Deltaproteobacteria bacterium]|nr:hypothetical protein [Deltaproteobacteria bacterium]
MTQIEEPSIAYSISSKPSQEEVVEIHTVNDIIVALKTHPHWLEEIRRLILTEELMRLPQRFDAFVKDDFKPLAQKVGNIETDVSELKNRVGVVETDVGVLKTDVAVLKTDVAVLKTDVSELKTDVRVLKTDVAELKTDVAVLKTDVAVLKTDVAELKTDVAVLKTDVAELKTDVAVLKTDVAKLTGRVNKIEIDVGDLKGNDFERRVRERAPSYFGKLIKKCRVVSHEMLADALDEALDQHIISEDERYEILNVDVVARGLSRHDPNREVVLVAEVSVKVDRVDVERAAKRAEIVSRVVQLPGIPIAIGKEATEGAKPRAEELQVVLVTP